MRFVCDSCRAQYMISDEKVGAKGVKVRCKKCGYVILVRKADSAAALPPPAPTDEGADATQVMQNPLVSSGGNTPPPPPNDPDVTNPGVPPNGSGGGALAGIGDDEIGAVFDQVLQSGTHKIPGDANVGGANGASLGESPDDRMSTRVLDAEVIKKLADEAARDGALANGNGAHVNGKNGHAAEKNTTVDHDWFVAIDEKQVGPLKLDKVKERWDSGEIGPDSLCWRAGFSDWLPLSEVAELASHLAPKPKQPVIVGSAPEPSLGAVVTVPVESAFTSGGVTRTVRSEVPVMTAAPAAGEDVGWKPSAASALASLVKEEIEALAKPAPVAKKKPEPEPEKEEKSAAIKGLLDLPSAEYQVPTDGATIKHPVDSGPPFSPAPSAHRSGPPVLSPQGPALTPAPFGAAPYQTSYKPAKSNKTLIYVGAAIALLFLLMIGGIVTLVIRQDQKLEQIAQKPAEQQPVMVAHSDAPSTQGTAVTPPPPTPAKTDTATAATTPTAAQPAAAPAKKDEPAKVADALPSSTKKEEASSERHSERPERTKHEGSSSRSDREDTKLVKAERKSEPSGGGEEIVAPGPSKKEDNKKADDDFGGGDSDQAFIDAFGDHSSKKKTETTKSDDKKSKKSADSVYIPPAPGAVDVPDNLSQSDIMQVVLGNRSAIKRCVDEQKKQNPGMSGRLVMSWVIKPSGSVSNVSVKTAEYKSTYMATCIGGLIKGWSFPKHKVQGDPIDFPFTF